MNQFSKFPMTALACGLLVFLGPLAGQSGTGGRQPIPGIDPIPRAVDPGGGGEEPGPGGDPTAPEEEALSGEQPMIRQLKVVKHPKLEHSALITWKVDPRNQTAIYIGRYSRPVSTRDLVFEADNLTAPPLGPRATQYVDRNIPDGTYYYVAVTSGEVSEGGNLLMRPNQNYTSQPFVVFRKDKGEVRRKRHYVINLTAVNNEDSVSLSWTPALARDVEHTIYRGRDPLDNAAALDAAVKLGTTPGTTYDFRDENPLRNEKVYYGVSITTRSDGREYKDLTQGESYIAHAFRPRLLGDLANWLPGGLVAYLQGGEDVKLMWTGPIERVRELKIYRSGVPISNVQRLGSAKFLGKVAGGRNEYFDRGLRPGRYYYALIPVKTDGSELREFWEGRTYTPDAILIRGGSGGPRITRLSAKATAARDISLRWDAFRDGKDALRYFLYRSDRPMQNAPDVREHGQLLRTFEAGVSSFVDQDLDPGRYFYALLIEVDGVLDERMVAGSNYLRRPVVLGGQRARNSAYELEYVLNMTYRRGLFEEAIRRLAPFIHNRNNPGEIVSRAMLYTGLSYYNLRLYRSALPIFMHAQVRRYYPERSRFWYNRTMEKLR